MGIAGIQIFQAGLGIGQADAGTVGGAASDTVAQLHDQSAGAYLGGNFHPATLAHGSDAVTDGVFRE